MSENPTEDHPAQNASAPAGSAPADAAPTSDEATILPGAAILGLEADDAPAALRALSARLREIGAVTDSFEAAVLLREEKHPTGLPTLVPAAVPHTDPEHVITPGFAIAVPTFPVAFGEVGSQGERRIWAELVIMLVLSDAGGQAAALQSLVAKLQEPDTVRDLLDASDDADLERRARAWLAG